MEILKTTDEQYPIKLDDSWGDGVYIHYTTIMNDAEWDAFIKELNEVRNEVKNRAKE